MTRCTCSRLLDACPVHDKLVYRPSWRAWVTVVGFWTLAGIVTFGFWFLLGKVTG